MPPAGQRGWPTGNSLTMIWSPAHLESGLWPHSSCLGGPAGGSSVASAVAAGTNRPRAATARMLAFI